MIELLLAADRLLAEGFPEQAERLYAQVAEADPRNAIAVVGLARVAQARGDEAEVLDYARRALAIDPEDVAARRLLEEGREPAEPAAPSAGPAVSAEPAPTVPGAPAAAEPSEPAAGEPAVAPARRSLLGRIRAFLGIGR
jgi:tetratricopeptide (TPR) repeat protein